MKFIRAHTLEISILGVLTLILLASRIYNLTSLPIFTDEAIYLRWAQIAKNDFSWIFISLTDGKQPLFIWLTIPFLYIFTDPLVAGRVVSIGAGIATLIGLFFVGKTLFKNTWVGIFTAALYIIYPMAVVYNRMALYDATVGAFAVWSLYFTILFARNLSLLYAISLGVIIGLSVLNKTNGFLSLYLLPFSLLLIDVSKKTLKKTFIKWIVGAGFVTVITYGIYFILRISPFFYIIKQKDGTFIYPLREWIKDPFFQVFENYKALTEWFIIYSTIGFLVLYIGSFLLNKKFFREKILLVIWFIVPLVLLILFGKTIYPRYIFPMTLSLLPLAAFSLVEIREKVKKYVWFISICCLLFSYPVWVDYKILTDFSLAPIPVADVTQYQTQWPAGGGVKEAVSFFEQKAKKGPLTIVTQGTFGLLPYAFEIYLGANKNIHIKSFWPVENLPPAIVTTAVVKMPTYLVFYQPCGACPTTGHAPLSWPVKKVLEIPKAKGVYFTVYEVTTK